MTAQADDPASADDAYLLGLRLHGRRVAVVGGGAVAARRVPRLLAAGADVLLVSPAVTPALEELAAQRRIDWRPREYRPGDCADAWLVVACTDRPSVNAAVADEAERPAPGARAPTTRPRPPPGRPRAGGSATPASRC